MSKLTHFPVDAPSADILEAISTQGAVIIDALADHQSTVSATSLQNAWSCAHGALR